MDFSQVINQSLTSVQKDCWNLAVGGKIMSPFWFNELLADIASFQGAMSKTVSFCDSHEKPMFKAITKSMEVEFQAIIESAKQLVEIDLESTAPYLTEEER